MPERIIHIQWDGPFSLDQVPSLDDATKDRGVCQVYAYHPVYGPGQLVDIGQTSDQTLPPESLSTIGAVARKTIPITTPFILAD
jgi:hypothetical protein